MNELGTIVQTISGLLSTIVAVIALYIAFRAEKRGHIRFSRELELAEKVAASQVKPLVTIVGQAHPHTKSLRLENRGVGPAVIKNIQFAKAAEVSKDIADLFNFPEHFKWEFIRLMPKSDLHIAAGNSIVLVRITDKHLESLGLPRESIDDIMRTWHAQKTGMKVTIEYDDALGNAQTPYSDILR